MNDDDSRGDVCSGGQVRLACATQSVLGEGPVYLADEDAVYWVDIKGAAVHRLGLAGETHDTWSMPEVLGWIIPRQAAAGFIAGFKSGFARLTLEPLSIEPIGSPESHLPDNRLNDAAVDRFGCIWAGTMDDREQAETGSLYRLDIAGHWTRQDTGYVVSNGPAFSPDHAFLYHADSAKRVVYRFRCAEDGSLGEREVFISFAEDWGTSGRDGDGRGGWHLDRALGRRAAQPVSAGRQPGPRDRVAGLAGHQLLFRRRRARTHVRDDGSYRP